MKEEMTSGEEAQLKRRTTLDSPGQEFLPAYAAVVDTAEAGDFAIQRFLIRIDVCFTKLKVRSQGRRDEMIDSVASQFDSRLHAPKPRKPGAAEKRVITSYPAYFALIRLANNRYAPGTPAGNSRNHEYEVKI